MYIIDCVGLLISKLFELGAEDEAEELSKSFCGAPISSATIVWNCDLKHNFF
jgi:hypothetical protein